MKSEDFDYLALIVGERALFGENINEEYSHDELSSVRTMPEAVVKVLSAEEISKILAYADAKHIPVTPRGSGTGLVGAAVPTEGGIVIDTSLMVSITDFDESNLTVTVQPGVLLMTLSEYCEERGLFYPPDPGEKTATIGGNISTNAGGMRAVKYGVTRDYVRALTVVLASGEIVRLGGKVVKNSSGFDIKDLFIGSEGTLGIIAEATLKLIPKPKCEMSLLVPFADLQAAIDAVPALIRERAQPTAIEFMQREVILDAENYLGVRFPDNSSDAYLLLKFDGDNTDEIKRKYAFVAELCLGLGAADVFLLDTDERSESVWKPRGAFLEAIKSGSEHMDEVDVVVPRSKVGAMVRKIEEIRRVTKTGIKYFGHAGDGNLHIYILGNGIGGEEWQIACEDTMRMLYDAAKELCGQVSGEHGIGIAKREYLNDSLESTVIELMRGIKSVFDPNGIMNPGKVI